MRKFLIGALLLLALPAYAGSVTSINGTVGSTAHFTVTDQNGVALSANLITCSGAPNITLVADTTTTNAAFNVTFIKASVGGQYSIACLDNDGGGASGSLGEQGISPTTSLKFTSP